jgi:hypothetical protein
MADLFTHFSCLLDVGTPDNAARALDLYQAFMRTQRARTCRPTAFFSPYSRSTAARRCGSAMTLQAIRSR